VVLASPRCRVDAVPRQAGLRSARAVPLHGVAGELLTRVSSTRRTVRVRPLNGVACRARLVRRLHRMMSVLSIGAAGSASLLVREAFFEGHVIVADKFRRHLARLLTAILATACGRSGSEHPASSTGSCPTTA